METRPNLEGARLPVSVEEGAVFPVMSREGMDFFLSHLESQGKPKATVETYRRCLERFFVFLPDAHIAPVERRNIGGRNGCRVGTANLHIAAAHSCLEWIGRRELHLKPIPHPVEWGRRL